MENKFLESALKLAGMGFHVFPLIANSKIPALKDYPNVATRNEAKIREWWTKKPRSNIGISTTYFGDGGAGLVAVDIDNKGEKKGDDEILRLELKGYDFPPTISQRTPTGGRHLLYLVGEAIGQSAGTIAPGIDTRSRGGYVVGAGSTLDGRFYSFEDGGDSVLAPAPLWLLRNNSSSETKNNPISSEIPKIDASQAVSRARSYLESAEPAVQGANGDQHTFAVAAKIKDLGVSLDGCISLMSGEWNDLCEPPWDFNDLVKKIKNAYAYGTEPIGVSAPETQFEKIEKEADPQEFYLEAMNKKYALIFVGGYHFILHETVDEKGHYRRDMLTEQSFKRALSTTVVQDGKKTKTHAEMWLDWKGRREFAGFCFAPEREAQHNYYNLWRGFTEKPTPYSDASEDAKKGFRDFCTHVLENICAGDKSHFSWLMGYFAHLVQKPYERPLTTIVFKGEKGVGKNVMIDRIGKLLSKSHYKVAHNSRYLTSNFNGHMDGCLCLVLDEAFWSGDKSAEGQLKGLTTAPEILIERKNQEPYSVDNLMRIVIIGNEDWLVPASSDERRYAVFEVGNARKQDNPYFEAMRINMDDKGGCAVLLDYFKNFDLSAVDVNKAPNTAALADQKMASLDIFQSWWHYCLAEGKIVHSEFGDSWPEEVSKDSFRSAFFREANERGAGKWKLSANALGRALKKCLPIEHIDGRKRDGEKTIGVYKLPPLSEARKKWDEMMGTKTNWGE